MRGEVVIDLNILMRNVVEYRKRIDKKVKLIGVVKADAYGHGAAEIAKSVSIFDGFAVATADEAVKLRAVTDKPILLLGFPYSCDAICEVINRKIAVSVWDKSQIGELENVGEKLGKCAFAHIAVDTGMNRIGLKNRYEFNELVNLINSCDSVSLAGVYSHFCDSGSDEVCKRQYKKFNSVIFDCPKDVSVHISATRRATDCKYFCDAVRLGIGMYGYGENFVKPCLSVKGKVVRNILIDGGESVGYNCAYTADKPCYIATLSLGYADGISRKSSGGDVLINGKRRRIVGNVCMDYCFAVSDSDVDVGNEVVFIGSQGNESITAEEVAMREGTIVYEVLTRFKRIPRIFV